MGVQVILSPDVVVRFLHVTERGTAVRRALGITAMFCVGGLVSAACAPGQDPGADGPPQALEQGGTLRLAIAADVDQAFDPAKEYTALSWEIFRCCLVRTLISFNGQEADEGGNEPRPDLAEDLPEVSDDGLTYTFRIKAGVRYAPPFDDVEVTAQDFVRAIEREACSRCSSEGYPFYFDVIEGFSESEGEPGSISGVSAPDDRTLSIRLTQPTGDFAYRMSLPAMAPIPAGAADGHETDYGRFLAATGPYMFEGSDALDFTVPPDQQTPVAGYDPGRSWTFVRNPSWDASTDELRQAYVDRIEVQINENTDVNYNALEAGDIDMVYDGVPPPHILQQYTTDPQLKDRLHANPSDGMRYLAMNLGEPPFDDIHVRRAMNLVMDKDGLRRVRGGPLFGPLAGHIVVNTLTDFQFEGYDPYATPQGRGNVEAARSEMAQSKYDSDGDGECDDPVCENVLMVADREDPYPDQNAVIEQSAEKIGIGFDVRSGDRYTFMFETCEDPRAHWGLCPSVGWFKDYADPLTFVLPLLDSSGIGSSNYSLVGALPQQMQEWGYSIREVPSLDDRIQECSILPVGEERTACWGELDRVAMEEVVPWVPWLFDNDVDIAGPRILNYTYDSSAGLMALDQIALAQGEAGGEA
jgi:peptide/nickel transport system substrate-binding protein